MGGGSLTFSILVHAAIFIIAGFIIFTSTIQTKNVDFLPGGGTAQGAKASQDMQQKVQNKRRHTLNKSTPIKKLVHSKGKNVRKARPMAAPVVTGLPR